VCSSSYAATTVHRPTCSELATAYTVQCSELIAVKSEFYRRTAEIPAVHRGHTRHEFRGPNIGGGAPWGPKMSAPMVSACRRKSIALQLLVPDQAVI